MSYRAMNLEELHEWLLNQLCDITGSALYQYHLADSLEEIGLSSLGAIQLSGQIEDYLRLSLAPDMLLAHSSVGALAVFLRENQGQNASVITRA